MPAETHQHAEPLTEDQVLAFISNVFDDGADVDPQTPLVELGLTDELDVLAYWDAAVEEHAERGIGDPDLTDLFEAETAGELARATVRCINHPGSS